MPKHFMGTSGQFILVVWTQCSTALSSSSVRPASCRSDGTDSECDALTTQTQDVLGYGYATKCGIWRSGLWHARPLGLDPDVPGGASQCGPGSTASLP
eukprot:scaffold4538_cov410-Prasinococcus_capsulatus_cf.AAC.7